METLTWRHKYRYFLWAVMVACWLIEGFSRRHTILADGVNYLDIASACSKGDWGALINGYWSPAYSFLLSVMLSIFRPAAARELIGVHCLNCLILVGALVSFELFMSGLLAYLPQSASSDGEEFGPPPEWVMRSTGYVLFFWATLYATPPSLENPDSLVFLLVLLASGFLVRIAAGKSQWLLFASFGATLGLSYLAKAAMFPVSFVFLCAGLPAAGNIRRAVPRILLALACFLLVSGPFMFALSKSKGHFTFGDAGKINYAEFVNGVPFYIHWQGGPAGAGTPVHPTRKILETPPVYEFATPLGGSYPPSTDQSYWYEGVRAHVEFRGQLNVLRHALDAYFELSIQLGGLFAALMMLHSVAPSGTFIRNLLRRYFLWIPSLAAMGLYSLVHVEPRFVSAFVVLLWAALFSALWVPCSGSAKSILRPAVAVMIILLGSQIVWAAGHDFLRLLSRREFPSLEIAQSMAREGIRPGDRVACIGDSPGDHYWAHLAGVTIVAEVPAEGLPSFLASGTDLRAQTLSALSGTGAKAIIAKDLPASILRDGWKQLGNTNYSVWLVPRGRTGLISAHPAGT
ncbi:MAG TPA: hypothetical protein VNH65_11690 [Candidatus Acidoferrum sp.]|nr:hypothetical protein [Candidatus Acidoferrum sp.]